MRLHAGSAFFRGRRGGTLVAAGQEGTRPLAESENDALLLERAAGGDLAALRALLEQFGPQVWREIDGQIGAKWRSLIDADDVMQVTYLEAFLQISGLEARTPAGFITWLRRIADRNMRDAMRHFERQKRPNPGRRVTAAVGEDSYVALVEMLGATSATPSRQAAGAELRGHIERALERLPSDYAKAVRLYDLEGRDIEAVAAAMGRSAGAVHMLRARAHDLIRVHLGAETNFFTDAG